MSHANFHSHETLALILAAGEGTRMRSKLPKVLHKVAHCSMVGHVIKAASDAQVHHLAVVIGPDRDDVAAEVKVQAPQASLFVQHDRRGTAHAVLMAKSALMGRHVVVMFGDTPLVQPSTVEALLAPVLEGAAVAVAAFEPQNPQGYGRLLMNEGQLVGIREDKDCTLEEKHIRLCNAGLMALHADHALALLERVDNQNAKNEFYLTDVVALACEASLPRAVVNVPAEDVLGVNDRSQLADVEAVLQSRLRQKALHAGVTLQAPDTVFLATDTVLAADVVIEPHVVFGPSVQVEEGAVIHAFSHLEGTHVSAGAHVGPYARLRPGARIGAGARIGNFVEVKNATFGEGAKANHLSYIGDAVVGAAANIGAGTITCNYDGFAKFTTTIGAGAFVGSNSSLVAPVTIADGAYVGSGSVITKDVSKDSLGVARGRQVNIDGWALSFREKQKINRK